MKLLPIAVNSSFLLEIAYLYHRANGSVGKVKIVKRVPPSLLQQCKAEQSFIVTDDCFKVFTQFTTFSWLPFHSFLHPKLSIQTRLLLLLITNTPYSLFQCTEEVLSHILGNSDKCPMYCHLCNAALYYYCINVHVTNIPAR